MHILLTNDDGPPDPHASPYIREFVRVLRAPPFNHNVSVVIPSQQRSWIGKAHLLPPAPSKTSSKPVSEAGRLDEPARKSKNEETDEFVRPVYYNPGTDAISQHIPTTNANEYWVLVPGTPAACAQLGLFHHHTLFPTSARQDDDANDENKSSLRAMLPDPSSESSSPTRASPVDLVISGPNHGRNTTAAFALSSGTLGGALEAAICGVRAIAVSFAFFTRVESDELVTQACVHSVKIIERLFKEWKSSPPTMKQGDRTEPDLFSVNIPLVDGVAENPVKWTWMLDNKWMAGSLYKTVATDADGSSKPQEENESKPVFKWAPTFSDVWKTVEESAPGNDGQVIRQHCSSVTPLKANYHGLHGTSGYEGELKL